MVFVYAGLNADAAGGYITTAVTDTTIYHDIVDAAATVTERIVLKFTNATGQALYYKVIPKAAAEQPNGYNVAAQELGTIANQATGSFTYINTTVTVANLAAIPAPPATLNDEVYLTIDAYTDAGYSILYDSVDVTIPVTWINSDHVGWTVDHEDNFDDGTVNGWTNTYDTELVADNSVYRSGSYSCSARRTSAYCNQCGMYKYLTATGTTAAFVVAYVRMTAQSMGLEIGHGYNISTTDYKMNLPANNTWYKVVFPVAANATTRVNLRIAVINTGTAQPPLWVDEIKLISASAA